MLASAFLPHLESDTFLNIVDNTMIQNDVGWPLVGWLIVVIAVLSAAALFRTWNRPKLTYSLLVLGGLGVACAVYAGTGERLELQSVGPGSARFGTTDTGSPGVGVYAAGVGSALIPARGRPAPVAGTG